jgi:hypothetical protein
MAKKSKKIQWSRKSKKRSPKKPMILSAVALAVGGALGKVFLSPRKN